MVATDIMALPGNTVLIFTELLFLLCNNNNLAAAVIVVFL